MKLNEFQFVVSHRHKYSNRNSEYYHELELIDPSTGDLRKTYISEDNYNSQLWDEIIDLLESRDNVAVCIRSDNFRTKRGKDNIINADTRVHYQGCYDLQEFCEQVWEIHYGG